MIRSARLAPDRPALLFLATLIASVVTACGGPTEGPATPAAPTPAAPTPSALIRVAPIVTFSASVPPGWTSGAGEGLPFSAGSNGGGLTIEVLPDRALMAASCELEPEAGVPLTAEAIVAAMASRPGLEASGRQPASISGLTGQQVDLRIATATGPTCPIDEPSFVPLFGYEGPAGWEFGGVADGERDRLIVLDGPNGHNLIIFVVAIDAASWDESIDDATAIVDGLSIQYGS